MNIVIVGAGSIGLFLAQLLSQENYNIVLIDSTPERLEIASRELDVATRVGDGTNWELLEEFLEIEPDLIVAVTNEDETNLLICTIAKELGYPKSVARVRKKQYFMHSSIDFEQLMRVDYLIGPEKLTADAIANMILIPQAIAIENFAHGQVQMRTVQIPASWRKAEISLSERKKLELPDDVMVGLIRRFSGEKQREEIVFPHGQTTLLPNDEVTFIGQTEAIHEIHKRFYHSTKQAKTVMILGGSLVSVYLAKQLLSKDMNVIILEQNYERCLMLTELLPKATIIKRDGLDFGYLKSQKIGEFDVFVACTDKDEVNFLCGCMAKNQGCESVIISLSDESYLSLTLQQGIKQVASARIHTANRILTIAREKTIASTVSMYNNKAEVMEIKVSKSSKIVGIPIRYLGPLLPKEMLIVNIQSRGRVFMADGSRVVTPGDTVVVISAPQHVDALRNMF